MADGTGALWRLEKKAAGSRFVSWQTLRLFSLTSQKKVQFCLGLVLVRVIQLLSWLVGYMVGYVVGYIVVYSWLVGLSQVWTCVKISITEVWKRAHRSLKKVWGSLLFQVFSIIV